MARAALIGTTIGYTDYYNSMVLETNDGRITSVSRDTFEYLYYRLDSFTAALRTDCIEYASNDPMIDLLTQPEWYIDACSDGVIYGSCGDDMFYDEHGGEYSISPNSVILRNRQGNLRYMEWDDFIKYYDIPGSEFID